MVAELGVRRAEEILLLADSDPETCLESARAALTATDDPLVRAILLRATSIAHRWLGDAVAALESSREALEAARSAGSVEQEVLAEHASTGPLMMMGDLSAAMSAVERAESLANTAYLKARCDFQRAAVVSRAGDTRLAISSIGAAVPVFRDMGDENMLQIGLQGLGGWLLEVGELERARAALTEALGLAKARRQLPSESGIRHNLGILSALQGDIPEALDQLTISDEIFMEVTGSEAPQHVARCEVLLSAGLFSEARHLATDIAAARRNAGDREHLERALIVAARAALAEGEAGEAVSLAKESAELSEQQGRSLLAAEARLTWIEARIEAEGPCEDLLVEASSALSSIGPEYEIARAQAHLLVARLAAELGHHDRALVALAGVDAVADAPIELLVQRRLVEARLHLLGEKEDGAAAALASGLMLLDDFQALLGATDLRLGIERHGAELGSLAVHLAVRTEDPAEVLGWMERTRARALQIRPTTGSKDEEVQQALVDLRRVEADMRTPEGRNDRALLSERHRMQERVAHLSRTSRQATLQRNEKDVSDVLERLEHRCLVEIADDNGELVAVVAIDGRLSLQKLGSATAAARELDHVRFGMRRAARRGRPCDANTLEALDRLLMRPLGELPDEVLIVPPPEFMAAPWSGLPSLRDRTITVSPSAALWAEACGRESGVINAAVIAGPDLAVADIESQSVARVYGGPAPIGEGAPIEAAREALLRADVAHVVAHATFNSQNPMFSSLRLFPGDLYVYDIERLESVPATVVLSACDSGYTEAASGSELAGLTSALLSMGSRNVVASVGLVPDTEITSSLMVRLHEGLKDGLSPSGALAEAQRDAFEDPDRFVSAASFICVGA